MRDNYVLFMILIILQGLTMLFCSWDRDSIMTTVKAGNMQILSTIDKNSCFHLELPSGSLVDGKKVKTK